MVPEHARVEVARTDVDVVAQLDIDALGVEDVLVTARRIDSGQRARTRNQVTARLAIAASIEVGRRHVIATFKHGVTRRDGYGVIEFDVVIVNSRLEALQEVGLPYETDRKRLRGFFLDVRVAADEAARLLRLRL